MPKQTLKYNSKEEIPAAFQPYAKDDFSVEVWVNNDDTAVAAELNPTLEANRNKILGEKKVVEDKYEALVRISGGEDIDKAKIVAENEELKRKAVPAEDVEIAKTVKTLFPNVQPANLKTEIETIQKKAQTGEVLERNQRDSQIADALGYKNVPYFKFALSQPELTEGIQGDLFAETVLENNKPVTKVYANVIQPDKTVQKTLFSEYQKTNPKWLEHTAGLMAGGQKEPENKGWIPQTGGEGDTGGGKGLVSAHVEKANSAATKVANPFMINAPQQAQGQGAGQPSAFEGVKQN